HRAAKLGQKDWVAMADGLRGDTHTHRDRAPTPPRAASERVGVARTCTAAASLACSTGRQGWQYYGDTIVILWRYYCDTMAILFGGSIPSPGGRARAGAAGEAGPQISCGQKPASPRPVPRKPTPSDLPRTRWLQLHVLHRGRAGEERT